MSALSLLTLAVAGGALAAALHLGRRPRRSVRTPSRGPAADEPDTNPFRTVGTLSMPAGAPPVQRADRAPRGSVGAPPPRASSAPIAADDAGDVRRLLGTRYRLVAEVPLVDLVRFQDRRFGSPAEHRALRVRTAPWVIGERADGRVRFVVAPEGGMRDLIVTALEADEVTVWSYERWIRERRASDPLELRNALVRDGLALDPPGTPR